jgi:sulfur carrier protein ThiS
MMQVERENFRIIACPHILSLEKDRLDVVRPVGGSVRDILRSIGWTRDGLSARVMIDGVLVPDARWETTVPQAGQSLVVRAVPMGGGGGEGKDIGRTVGMIAIMIAAIAAQQYWAATFVGVAAIAASSAVVAGSIAASLALNGLIPSPLPRRALPQPARELKEAA